MVDIVIGMESDKNLPCWVWKGAKNFNSNCLARNGIKSSMMELFEVRSSECKLPWDILEIFGRFIDSSWEIFMFWGNNVKVSIQEESLVAKKPSFDVGRSGFSWFRRSVWSDFSPSQVKVDFFLESSYNIDWQVLSLIHNFDCIWIIELRVFRSKRNVDLNTQMWEVCNFVEVKNTWTPNVIAIESDTSLKQGSVCKHEVEVVGLFNWCPSPRSCRHKQSASVSHKAENTGNVPARPIYDRFCRMKNLDHSLCCSVGWFEICLGFHDKWRIVELSSHEPIFDVGMKGSDWGIWVPPCCEVIAIWTLGHNDDSSVTDFSGTDQHIVDRISDSNNWRVHSKDYGLTWSSFFG